MLEQDAVWEIDNVPLSDSTINRHTDDMSHDAGENLCDELKSKFLYPDWWVLRFHQ
jgi:hypothetical protein